MFHNRKVLGFLLVLSISLVLTGITCASALAKDDIFTLHLAVDPSDKLRFNIARILQNEFSKLGINLKIESMENSVISDITWSAEYGPKPFEEGGWDMDLGTYWWWPNDYVWFKGCYHSTGQPPSGWNYWLWNNGLADYHLEEGLTTYDTEKRKKHLKKWQEIFSQDPPHANIYWPQTPQVTTKPLKGINGFLWTHNIFQWYWADNRDDTTVIYATQSKLQNLNPLFLNGSYFWVEPQYEPLYKLFYDAENKEYDYVPAMAADLPQYSEDGLTVTIPIRKGVTWHDGEPMTAEDVKFTFDTILDKETGASSRGDLNGILESVEMKDEYTIVLHLSKPVPYLVSLLASGSTSIIPQHALGNVPHSKLRGHSTNVDKPAPGTGPFKFETWKKGESMELVANENYWKGEPAVERVVFQVIPEPSSALMALETGEVDALSPYLGEGVSGEIKRLQEEPSVQVELFTSGAIGFLAFNNQHPILNNKYVRKALSYAIPREHITQNILHGLGTPANSPVPPFWFAYNDELPSPQYDIEKAKELLRKAGYDVP